MARVFSLTVLSDIHYACAAEQALGDNYEFEMVGNPLVRMLLKTYRNFIWLRHPLRQNHLLDQFLERAGEPDWVVANGDYSCDSSCIGMADARARQSAAECLDRLRGRFGPRLRATLGDHELGKLSLGGKRGGMRLASLRCARETLGLEPFWRTDVAEYALIGVASSLVALPVFEPDTLPEERPEWHQQRREHLEQIRAAFSALKPGQRVLLFCHDPTALPFLAQEKEVRDRLPQISQTVIGHLHSNLVLWKGRLLAGMPPVGFLGPSVLRMSRALHEARWWKPFRVRLCPSLAGVELLKDGGFLRVELDEDSRRPPRFQLHRIKR